MHAEDVTGGLDMGLLGHDAPEECRRRLIGSQLRKGSRVNLSAVAGVLTTKGEYVKPESTRASGSGSG